MDFVYVSLILSGFAFAGLIFLGVHLSRRSRRTRIGTEPHCGKCDYLLIGISAERCPECGNPTHPAGIVLGEAHHSKRLIVGCFAAGALAFAFLGAMIADVKIIASTINWYQFHPTAWIMHDLRTGTGKPAPNVLTPLTSRNFGHGWASERVDLARVAFEELLRRDKAGGLSEEYRNEIVELGLAVQQPGPQMAPVQYDLLTYLGDRAIAGDLSHDQEDRFYKPALDVVLTARPIVLQGDAIPVRFAMRRSWASPGVGWQMDFIFSSIEIDGHAAALSPPPASYERWLSADYPDDSTVLCSALGHHVLAVTVKMNVHHGSGGYPERGPVMRSSTVTLAAPFDVIVPSREHDVKLIDDASIAAKLRTLMSPRDFQYNLWNPGHIYGTIDVNPAPVNMAFEVFARYGGHEYPIGRFMKAAEGLSHEFRCDSEPDTSLPKPPARIDVVLRSSPKAARATLALHKIWNGEIVLAGVPITDTAAH